MFRVDTEAARGITVDEDISDLIHELFIHAEVEFTDIHGFVIVFRLIQSQLETGSVSAAGSVFNADITGCVASPKRLQIVEDGIGQGNHTVPHCWVDKNAL